jgi:hypothetical protein
MKTAYLDLQQKTAAVQQAAREDLRQLSIEMFWQSG